ncbi:hypothetical protein PROFUN_12613 [Planoprotostelium fungivorum]|uniref:RNA helicase n=1 Tax=Planoprotostelium fungivorum TaxID=1890364 RepID=A0A2P6N715_9EUKA|nr:hypothetical protein PROFUN_12613 [Planoprotostelium fungivorum]
MSQTHDNGNLRSADSNSTERNNSNGASSRPEAGRYVPPSLRSRASEERAPPRDGGTTDFPLETKEEASVVTSAGMTEEVERASVVVAPPLSEETTVVTEVAAILEGDLILLTPSSGGFAPRDNGGFGGKASGGWGGRGGSSGGGWGGGRDRYEREEPNPFEEDPALAELPTGEGDKIEFDRYDDIPVETSGDNCPRNIETWEEVKLHPTVENNIKLSKFMKPTPIQKYSLPIVLSNRDLMGCAQTGSGKTAAFLLPVIEKLLSEPPHDSVVSQGGGRKKVYPVALVLAPTRELALQIYGGARKFCYKTGLKTTVVYGGTPIVNQLRELERGCDILIATPGRLVDIIDRAKVSLQAIRYLTLDEADRMLDMGFEPQIRRIVEEEDMPRTGDRQTLMFSATFPKEIQRLAASFLEDYIFLAVGRVGSTTDLVTQKFLRAEESDKQGMLLDLIASVKGLTLIFVETKKKADQLEDFLQRENFPATSIHGDRDQADRQAALRTFSTGQTPYLVATSVAARGLHIENVAHVINYDMPNDANEYVHRIGRTGRAGKPGLATALISEDNMGVVPKLLELLSDSGQEIPPWLESMRSHRGYGGHGGHHGGRRGGAKFGGKDFRTDRGSRDDRGRNDSWGGNSGFGGGYGGGYGGGNSGGVLKTLVCSSQSGLVFKTSRTRDLPLNNEVRKEYLSRLCEVLMKIEPTLDKESGITVLTGRSEEHSSRCCLSGNHPTSTSRSSRHANHPDRTIMETNDSGKAIEMNRVATVDDVHKTDGIADPNPPVEEPKEFQPAVSKLMPSKLREFLSTSMSAPDPEEVEGKMRRNDEDEFGEPQGTEEKQAATQSAPLTPEFYTGMPKPAAASTIEGKGTKSQRYLASWKMWRHNHNPMNAFTLFALRQYIAEMVGTALLVFCGCGSIVALSAKSSLEVAGTNISISLCFGFAVAAMVYATANVSGGHLNPAVTLALMATSNKNLLKGVFYIIAQLVGSVLGAALLRGATSQVAWQPVYLGVSRLLNNETVPQAVLMEIVLTFLLVFTVFGTVKMDLSSTSMGRLAGLSIGLAVLVGHLVGTAFTGPSMNPARSFGPALVSWYWEYHWVFWVGPIVGGLLAALLFQFVLQPEHHEPSPENQVRRDVIENQKIIDKTMKIEGEAAEEGSESSQDSPTEESPASAAATGKTQRKNFQDNGQTRDSSREAINHDSAQAE